MAFESIFGLGKKSVTALLKDSFVKDTCRVGHGSKQRLKPL